MYRDGDYFYKSVRVKLPNGKIRKAELLSETIEGGRSARVSLNGVRVRGKVPSTKYGWTDRTILPFKVNALDEVFAS